MTEFGTYVLKYKAPKGSGESKVKMEITSEATIPQMLEFFTDFLKASGYCIDEDRELVFERKAPDFSQNFWAEDGISMTGNPYAAPDTISFGSTPPSYSTNGYWMANGTDNITLG